MTRTLVAFPHYGNTTPLCGPSRAGAWTTRLARATGNASNSATQQRVNAGIPWEYTIQAALRSYNVATGWVGKHINGYPWRELLVADGWTDDAARRLTPPYFDDFRGAKGHGEEFTMVENGRLVFYGPDVANVDNRLYQTDAEARHMVRQVSTLREPFVSIWSSSAPHAVGGQTSPVYIPAPRHADVEIDLVDPPNLNPADISTGPYWQRRRWPDQHDAAKIADWQERHRNALRMCLALDEGLEDIYDALIARGVYDRTAVIVWPDNSNAHGEHRHIGKGAAWDTCIRGPLLVDWPDVPADTPINVVLLIFDDGPGQWLELGFPLLNDRFVGCDILDTLVTNVDIAPTVVRAASGGVGTMPAAPDGMDFGPIVRGERTAFRRVAVLQYGPGPSESDVGPFTGPTTYSGCYTTELKLMKYADGTGYEMYDLTDGRFGDPRAEQAEELVNIWDTDDPAHQQMAVDLAILRRHQYNGDPPDGYPILVDDDDDAVDPDGEDT